MTRFRGPCDSGSAALTAAHEDEGAEALTPWLPNRKPLAAPRLRLFCFPYAGGSVSAFQGWSEALPEGVELCAVQPPGRERRLMERPFRRLPELLDALEPVLLPLLDKPFVLLGYSMGTRIALALTQRWQERGGPQPQGLVMCAAAAPHVSRPSRESLDDARFLELLRNYEGTPPEVLAHRELMELLLPVLRADFALSDTVLPTTPVRCPMSVWGGLEDPHVSSEELERWRELSAGEFRIRRFPGRHFFLRTHRDALLAALHSELTGYLARDP
ncbi:thioesterase II family protein [Hyalangium rubrum]|uniref:Thioesterase domain-containing protein n=1 Tax=Hyalangium rubrum TaxID=3103134 RepID=A0ABU5GW54_9BACT|nr:thioesterase domain-containing protein [Hyalangium sp. s54d21]MDY7225112.1 thioesterase domain-containing protein [Hyalangium sp. s54d21]